MDVCGPLPVTNRGNKYILGAADYFSKWPKCQAIPDQEAKTIARCLEDRHGVPQALLTDQGKNFECKVISETCKLLKIEKLRTTAYHPQCDGQVERFNRTLGNMLATIAGNNQKEWDLYLQQVLLAYRKSNNESTGATPFSLLYGREARLPVDLCFDPPPDHDQSVTTYGEYTRQLKERLDTLFQVASSRKSDKQMNMTGRHGEAHTAKETECGYLTRVHHVDSLPN